jgi:hypothetical protein
MGPIPGNLQESSGVAAPSVWRVLRLGRLRPRSRSYTRRRADELQWENRQLGLPSEGGFVRGLVELEAESERQSLLFGTRTSFFNGLYYLLGLPSAILAAIAGATILASAAGRVAAGIIALVASGLSAAVAFLDAGKQREKSAVVRTYWDDLYNDVHVARLTKLETYTEQSGPLALSGFYSRASGIRAGRDPSAYTGESGAAGSSGDAKLLFPPRN